MLLSLAYGSHFLPIGAEFDQQLNDTSFFFALAVVIRGHQQEKQ
jgi:hypothetical protein